MADVFISYANVNRTIAQMLSDSLATQGWSVWWDRDILIGQDFHKIIQRAIETTRSVLVVWSQESVSSSWVLDEATEGRTRNILFPVRIDNASIPFGFRTLQTADLVGWKGEIEHAGLQTLMKALGSHLGGSRELPIEEALRLVQKFCKMRKIMLDGKSSSGVSSSGAKFIAAQTIDAMGCVYCHMTGSHLGEVYYVRKGISIYFHRNLGGPSSSLGLPVSNEELVDGKGHPTSFFENGYIDWSPITGVARAVLVLIDGERPFGEPAEL